eukprot:2993271-Alexandrium_andersonii.AAC.1
MEAPSTGWCWPRSVKLPGNDEERENWEARALEAWVNWCDAQNWSETQAKLRVLAIGVGRDAGKARQDLWTKLCQGAEAALLAAARTLP